MSTGGPIPDSYWIEFSDLDFDKRPPGRFLAGEYPGAKNPEEARRKVENMLNAGVELFIDLTEAGEYSLRPYAPIAAASAGEKGIVMAHQRISIPDMGVPSIRQMKKILGSIDKAVSNGKTVYVHCYGGIGRTGTVVGCWLVRHGLTGRQALARIGAWRRGTSDGWRRSPETDEQRELVLGWKPGK